MTKKLGMFLAATAVLACAVPALARGATGYARADRKILRSRTSVK
jgi:hypothetical protein